MTKFDVLSDIHCDLWIKSNPTVNKFKRFINIHVKPVSDYIIIAGDLAHDKENGLMFLKALQSFYKRVIIVLGNHDYYMTKREQLSYPSYKERIDVYKNEMRLMNIDILDGDLIKIDDVKIGGMGGWYDFSYIDMFWKNIPDYEIGKLWSDTMNDSNWIKGLKGNTHLESFDNVRSLFADEMEKFYKNDKLKTVDIFVTHVSPVNEPVYIPEEFRYDKMTSFFCYNGIEDIKDSSAKYWIFGHTHTKMEYELFDTKMICNPLGYQHENNKAKAIQIEV
jgi:predicted phosphodiesterase